MLSKRLFLFWNMSQTTKIFREDLEIATAILKRDEAVTRSFFYKDCYPLFRAIYQNYTTDCDSCLEFMNEIYVLIMTPSQNTGRCQLQNYRGESSLRTWLKVTALYYCYAQYEKKERMPLLEPLNHQDFEENDDTFDRLIGDNLSITIDEGNIERHDLEQLMKLMPSARFRELLRLRYVEHLTNEEVAKKLGMTMPNYYNNHSRAKEQFMTIYRKEENHG